MQLWGDCFHAGELSSVCALANRRRGGKVENDGSAVGSRTIPSH